MIILPVFRIFNRISPADAELKATASAQTVPGAMRGCVFQTRIVLPVVVLEGRMRNLNKEEKEMLCVAEAPCRV